MTMLSSGASYSSSLHTHIPTGMAANGFNMTVVTYVSDVLGSTAVTSLGADNEPLVLVVTPPDQVRVDVVSRITRNRCGVESIAFEICRAGNG